MAVCTSELIDFLKKQTVSATFLERLKINYRPLICPFDELLSFIEPGAKVLDIGCGAGQFLTLVAEFTQAKMLAGLEISPRLVEQANKLLQPYKNQATVTIQRFDGLNFPGFLAECDTVFLIDVLHHVPAKDQELFLKNIYQGMAPGAKLILKDIDAASPWVYFNKMHDLILAKEIGNELSVEKAKQLVTETGFEVKNCLKKRLFGYPHYTLILKK